MILPKRFNDDQDDDNIEPDELYDAIYDVLNDLECDDELDDEVVASKEQLKKRSLRQLKLKRIPRKPKIDQFLGRGKEFVQAWMHRRDIFAPTTSASIQATSGVLRHGYTSYKAFLTAWMVVMSPYYSKVNTSRVIATAGAATVATLNGNCAGVMFAFGDQNLNAERAPFNVTLTFGGKTLTFLFKPSRTPAGAGILLPNDNVGLAQIGNFATVVATVAADTIRPGSWIFLETLNAFDIRY